MGWCDDLFTGIFKGPARALDETVGVWWSQAHEAAAQNRTDVAVHRFRKAHAGDRTFVAEAPKSNWKPIDQPRQGSADDVKDTNFFGTYTEKKHWFWG
jgi:hypothetical protein